MAFPTPARHVPRATRHVSRATCLVPRATCHVLHVTYLSGLYGFCSAFATDLCRFTFQDRFWSSVAKSPMRTTASAPVPPFSRMRFLWLLLQRLF
mmetsp:Transcript_2376/g.4492  ORF Transcript_2376/g.4492 Transcript_2376/m.4492 type:complete len:95 (+) Transcript_2376:1555-1839(+)